MRRYIVRKLLFAVVTIILVLTLNFTLIHLAPGDPTTIMMGSDESSPELRQALMEKYGLDKPLYVQYFRYLKQLALGDMGTSIIYSRPVWDIISEKLAPTFLLILTASILSLIIGCAVGIQCAQHEGSLLDGVFSFISYVCNAMPSFWVGLMLIILLANQLHLLPASGMIDPRIKHTGLAHILDVARHMVLPVLALMLSSIPAYFRISKSSVLQVKNEDFITTFRATGMKEGLIFRRYVFKNAILPPVTIFGIRLAFMISGVTLVETVFAWPGTGRVMMTAINQRDYTVLMGMYLVMSVTVALMMVVVDIVYAVLDPRIRY